MKAADMKNKNLILDRMNGIYWILNDVRNGAFYSLMTDLIPPKHTAQTRQE